LRYKIFRPSLGRFSIFSLQSISFSRSKEADEVFSIFSPVKARDFLDFAGETSLNGVFPTGELIRPDLDFLHGGLAFSGVSRVLLLVLTGVDVVAVAAFLTN